MAGATDHALDTTMHQDLPVHASVHTGNDYPAQPVVLMSGWAIAPNNALRVLFKKK